MLENYQDDRGNQIRFAGRVERGVRVVFRGSNNVLEVDDKPHLKSVTISFDCDNGVRVKESRSIVLGDHVRFAVGSSVLGGSSIGSGTVWGFNALVIAGSRTT